MFKTATSEALVILEVRMQVCTLYASLQCVNMKCTFPIEPNHSS